MKKYMNAMLLMLLVHIQSADAQTGDVATSVQTEKVEMGVLATGRLSTVNVWFPKGKCAALDEKPLNDKPLNDKQLCVAEGARANRVIVLSHGAMGSARGLSWIAEKLAADGFVVIGVNHFGEASVYGPDTQDPRTTSLIWQRPQDISALLDMLKLKDMFQKKVDWSNVVVIGHSSGGQTAAMLAGATFDLQRLIDYCGSDHAKDDVSCNYGSNAPSAPEAFRREFRASQHDVRVKMVVMLDPALGSAVQPESLRKVKIPALVIGAQNNDFLPWKQHGLRYATEIPNAKVNPLKGQEGHFVFISACQHKTKVMGVSLCEDREGVDRKATQAMVKTSAQPHKTQRI